MKKDNKIVVEQAESVQPTMTLNDVLREISYLQWVIAREDGDGAEARDALQNLYDLRDKMLELEDE